MNEDKPLPQNTKVERAIIASCINDPQCFASCRGRGILPEYFMDSTCRTLWKSLERINNATPGQYDIMAVLHDLKGSETTEIEIMAIVADCPISTALESWLGILTMLYARRRMINISSIYNNNIINDNNEFIDTTEKLIEDTRKLIQIAETREEVDNDTLIMEAHEQVEKQSTCPEKYVVSYGISGVDEQIRHARGTTHVLAALPGTGKTGFALSVLQEQMQIGVKHVLFCNETSTQDLFIRLFAIVSDLSSMAMCNITRIDSAQLTGKYLPALGKIRQFKDNFRIYGKGQYSHSPEGIRAKLGELRDRRFKADMVTVDYLQTMKTPLDKKTAKHEQIEYCVFELSQIFSELNVAGLVLSQLNRDKSRDNTQRAGTMGDLKGSSSIEQEADIVSFLQRENKGIEGRVPVKWYSDKVRGPKVIDCELEFNSSNGRFHKVITNHTGRQY